MTDEKPDSASLAQLGERLQAARKGEEGGNYAKKSGVVGSALGLGFRIVTELLAAVVVGGAIGYGLDQWLGCAPWLMALFLFLGGASGVLNAYRAAKSHVSRTEAAEGQNRQDGR